MMNRRILAAAFWTVAWGTCAVGNTLAAAGNAFAGNYGWAAAYMISALCALSLSRTARRRWRGRVLAAEIRRCTTRMLTAKMCVPPGHMWRHPASEPPHPGWCLCGEMYRNQDECDAENWRCEP